MIEALTILGLSFVLLGVTAYGIYFTTKYILLDKFEEE
jgi:hypothetical protein